VLVQTVETFAASWNITHIDILKIAVNGEHPESLDS
jgi:hypothetical protein